MHGTDRESDLREIFGWRYSVSVKKFADYSLVLRLPTVYVVCIPFLLTAALLVADVQGQNLFWRCLR